MRLRFVILAVAVVAIPTPALADPAAERRIIAEYADCVVRRHHDDAAAAILSDAPNRAYYGRDSKLADQICLTNAARFAGSMRADGDAYRGAIADALVHADLAATAAPDISLVPALSHRDAYPVRTVDEKTGKPLAAAAIARQQEGFDKAKMANWLARIGECVVRTDIAGSKAVLATRVTTPEELAALKVLAPSLAGCLPRGVTLSFDRTALRGTIAVNYYRLAMAVKDVDPVVAGRGGGK